MLSFLLSLLGILLTIFFVIGTHEAGHFLTARLLGVKVLCFSIGFGKTLIRWFDKKGTEYIIAIIPLGGYVRMVDEREGPVAENDLPFAFNRQPFYKKSLIVLAGPVTNLMCAFFLYWLIFVIGFVSVKPIIGQVTPQSIAAVSGLKPNQIILNIDNKPTPTWTNVIFRLLSHFGNQESLSMTVENMADNKKTSTLLNLSNWHLDELNPEPLESLGIKPLTPPIPLVIGIITPHSPAHLSNLKIGDKIISIEKKPINNWKEVLTTITQHPDQVLTFTVLRQGKKQDVPVKIGYQRNLLFQYSGYLGIGPSFQWPKTFLTKIQYSPLAAVPHAWQEMIDFSYFNLLVMGKMITGKISIQSLGGPITIFETAGSALNYGLLSFLTFLAFLSIAIGVINLVPIPGLDGGHLLFQTIELIIRRPIPDQVMLNLYRIGFLVLFFLLLQALINDVLRLY